MFAWTSVTEGYEYNAFIKVYIQKRGLLFSEDIAFVSAKLAQYVSGLDFWQWREIIHSRNV